MTTKTTETSWGPYAATYTETTGAKGRRTATLVVHGSGVRGRVKERADGKARTMIWVDAPGAGDKGGRCVHSSVAPSFMGGMNTMSAYLYRRN